MTFRSRALPLISLGFSVIPLAPNGKSPVGPGATGRSRDLATIDAWAAQWPTANVGICADENITILESDDAARLRGVLDQQGVALPLTLTGGASENRPHWFYRRTPACGDECITVPGLFEFRNKNQYVVGPGSIHPSGAVYRFWNDAPIAELPAGVINALREMSDNYAGEGKGEHIQPGPYAKLRHAYLRRLDPADLLTLENLDVSEGERHYTLMSLAGLLHDGERSAEDIAEILRDVQATYFDGSKGDDEIERVAYYATRGEPCSFEPFELPSFSVGTRVFATAAAMEQWLQANRDTFSVDWEYMRGQTHPEQRVFVRLNGEPLIREETVSEVFAFRGLGKSMFMGSLIRTLVKGDEFLGIKSDGGHKVLLVDGELPERLLQRRLNNLVGPGTAGLFRVRSLAQVKKHHMPALALPAVQEEFVANLKAWQPEVIIFDTRTAVFKHDTNDQGQLLAVNEFLISLRADGYAVILTHHAGKNGTQRGRTDNDDITDLIIQLKQRPGWTPGTGLEFSLAFEKVRYGDRLEGFDAKWSREDGWERVTTSDNEVVNALLDGGSVNAVAKKFKIGNGKVAAIKKRAEENGQEFPDNKAGRKLGER